MTSMDAIWLVLVKAGVVFSRHFVATHPPPPSHPVGVLLILATPVKKLSKMAGNSASYSPHSWWVCHANIGPPKICPARPILAENFAKIGPPPGPLLLPNRSPRTSFGSQNWSPLANFGPPVTYKSGIIYIESWQIA